MLADRKIPFSESKEQEWELLIQKTEGGIELMLEDSERWFLATPEGDGIRITSAEKTCGRLPFAKPPLIKFDEFKRVAEVYNDSFFRRNRGSIGKTRCPQLKPEHAVSLYDDLLSDLDSAESSKCIKNHLTAFEKIILDQARLTERRTA